MIAPAALVTLVVAAAATAAEAAVASLSSSSRIAFCGKQPCLLPNECRDEEGVSVCVRIDGSQCSNTQCAAGFQCVLMQDVCASLPCHPKAYCVKSNPCGDCSSPDHFCQLIPTPVCRPVVQPTCQNKVCSEGEACSESPDARCTSPPCRAQLVCSASGWYQADGGAAGEGFGELGSESKRSEERRLKPGAGSRSGKNGDDDEDDD